MTDDSLVWDIIQFKYMILVIIIVFMNINFQRGDTLKQKTLHTLTTMGLSLDIPWFHQFLLVSIFVDLEKKITIFRIRTSTFVPKNMLYRVLLSLDIQFRGSCVRMYSTNIDHMMNQNAPSKVYIDAMKVGCKNVASTQA